MDGGGGGPAPFLMKTYEMVDDTSTDAIVSWSTSRKSFIVWNPPEFARVLLPSYFKHNNFSSFIRQLNTYGFRKIDPERWEFANEDFVKDQKHHLKNIHRRKPIHSHSQPQGSVDPERAAFEEEIDTLSREKAVLEGKVLGYEEQQSDAKVQLEILSQRVANMEQRQARLITFLDKAIQKPEFIELLAQKLEAIDFSAYNKKRRLPEADRSKSVQENIFLDEGISSRHELGDISPQELSSKLRLELSPTVSDINLPSRSTPSSNEDGACPLGLMDVWPKDDQIRTAGFPCRPETLELTDTGSSFTLNIESSFPCKAGPGSPKPYSMQQNSISNDDDCHISCLLNLSLSSSPLELNRTQNLTTAPLSSQDTDVDSRLDVGISDTSYMSPPSKRAQPGDAHAPSSSHTVHNDKQAVATPQNRVNDVFWEQFLTERPGCLDTEEARSKKTTPTNEQEEKKSGKRMTVDTKDVEHLTL